MSYSKFTRFDLTYQLTNYPQNTGMSQESVKVAIAKAFDRWQRALRFTFRPITSATETPDITLTFGSLSKGDGVDALAFTNEVTHAITFDNTRTWADYAECSIWDNTIIKADLLSISIHEIGHVLGLVDSSDSASVMYGTADCDRMRKMHDASIPQVDITNVEQGYKNLYYDPNTIKWYKKGTGLGFKFRHVIAAADGTVLGLDLNGQLCDFRPNRDDGGPVWTILGKGITRVAVSRFSKLVLAIFSPYDNPYRKNISNSIWDGDLKRYDGQGNWIGVSAGSLGNGTKFTHVAVNSAGSVWAQARHQVTGPDKVTQFHVRQIVRYEGDIASGTGDWKAAPIDPRLDVNSQSADIAVGRRSSEGPPLIWGSAPTSTYDSNPIFGEWNEQRNEWGRVPQFPHIESSVGNPPQFSPERLRYGLVGKCVSIGDDGTVVRVADKTAYRLDGATWTPLPGQVIDVSVVTKTNMWAVDLDNDICSTSPY
jgi:hypothetical protein